MKHFRRILMSMLLSLLITPAVQFIYIRDQDRGDRGQARKAKPMVRISRRGAIEAGRSKADRTGSLSYSVRGGRDGPGLAANFRAGVGNFHVVFDSDYWAERA